MSILIDSPVELLTIEVFGEDGDRRAFSYALSIAGAMEWLDTAPLCRTPEEALAIRIEDRYHVGCWLFVEPLGAPPDWIKSAAAKRLLVRVSGAGVRRQP